MAGRHQQALGRTPNRGGVGELVEHAGDGVPRFGVDGHSFFTRSISLAAARNLVEFNMAGDFLYVSDASDQDANFTLRFNSQRNSGVNVKLGRLIAGFRFDKMYISNDAQAGKSITLEYGVTDRGLQLQMLNPTSLLSTVSLQKQGTVTNFGPVAIGAAATLIAAANTDRREIAISNLSTTDLCHIGGLNVGITTGIELQPSQTVFLDTTAAIYGIRVNALNVSGVEIEI